MGLRSLAKKSSCYNNKYILNESERSVPEQQALSFTIVFLIIIHCVMLPLYFFKMTLSTKHIPFVKCLCSMSFSSRPKFRNSFETYWNPQKRIELQSAVKQHWQFFRYTHVFYFNKVHSRSFIYSTWYHDNKGCGQNVAFSTSGAGLIINGNLTVIIQHHRLFSSFSNYKLKCGMRY